MSEFDVPHGLILTHWVGPEHITQYCGIFGFLLSIQFIDVLNFFEAWHDATMHAEELAIDNCCDRESIEEFHEVFVNLRIIVLDALMPKVKIAGTFSCLVITAQKYHILTLFDLHCAQISNDLWTIHSTIDIVTHKDELFDTTRVRIHLFKHIKHVVQLSMDIADYSNSSIDPHQIWLLFHKLLGPEKQG